MKKNKHIVFEDIKNQINNISFDFLVEYLVKAHKWKLMHA
jgi:hypothetical protein